MTLPECLLRGHGRLSACLQRRCRSLGDVAAHGGINHVAVYAGQQTINGVLTDIINQHSGGVKLHDDWMPNSAEYTHAPAQVEFVHLKYPGD